MGKNEFCEKCKGRFYHSEEKERQSRVAKEFKVIPKFCIKNDECPYLTQEK